MKHAALIEEGKDAELDPAMVLEFVNATGPLLSHSVSQKGHVAVMRVKGRGKESGQKNTASPTAMGGEI